MLVIGITGGIGCGKSEVSMIIEKNGYLVYNLDQAAKSIMIKNEIVKNKIINSFGKESYNEDGSLNSEYLSHNVYESTSKSNLDILNKIVHPVVIDELISIVNDEEVAGRSIMFVESALIYEAALENGFDYIIGVDATEEQRIERLVNSRGLTKEKIQLIMNNQLSHQYKVEQSDFKIINTSSIEKLKGSVDMILEIIKSMPEKEKYSFESAEN